MVVRAVQRRGAAASMLVVVLGTLLVGAARAQYGRPPVLSIGALEDLDGPTNFKVELYGGVRFRCPSNMERFPLPPVFLTPDIIYIDEVLHVTKKAYDECDVRSADAYASAIASLCAQRAGVSEETTLRLMPREQTDDPNFLWNLGTNYGFVGFEVGKTYYFISTLGGTGVRADGFPATRGQRAGLGGLCALGHKFSLTVVPSMPGCTNVQCCGLTTPPHIDPIPSCFLSRGRSVCNEYANPNHLVPCDDGLSSSVGDYCNLFSVCTGLTPVSINFGPTPANYSSGADGPVIVDDATVRVITNRTSGAFVDQSNPSVVSDLRLEVAARAGILADDLDTFRLAVVQGELLLTFKYNNSRMEEDVMEAAIVATPLPLPNAFGELQNVTAVESRKAPSSGDNSTASFPWYLIVIGVVLVGVAVAAAVLYSKRENSPSRRTAPAIDYAYGASVTGAFEHSNAIYDPAASKKSVSMGSTLPYGHHQVVPNPTYDAQIRLRTDSAASYVSRGDAESVTEC